MTFSRAYDQSYLAQIILGVNYVKDELQTVIVVIHCSCGMFVVCMGLRICIFMQSRDLLPYVRENPTTGIQLVYM